jgi:molybdopterin-containing oxidoreductase family iron-sulfur binding subunit
VYERPDAAPKAYTVNEGAASEAAAKVASSYGPGEGTDLYVYQSVALGIGNDSGNPWLQELPDPITKCTWDNYVCVGPRMADSMGLTTGSVANVKAGGLDAKLPVIVVPGMHPQTIAVAVGYGRTNVGKAGREVGVNAYPAVQWQDGLAMPFVKGATISAVDGEEYDLAITQRQPTASVDARKHHVVRELPLVEFVQNPNAIKEEVAATAHHLVQLYPDYTQQPGQGLRWAMAIDLNACTGCGACVVACNAENNVAVVGKEEVSTGREMHWLRIDRYFSSAVENRSDLEGSNIPEEFPEVIFQPMLCQHCNNAPCENVCPVLATVHSDEGMNQQVYNRCFGTRYCANNCPYKVRRFNWFDYTNSEVWQYNPIDDLGRMVLNPDVTVRCRGVMEKCSFCVQRTQAAKLKAKRENRTLRDADISTACAKSCPTGAIAFGNINDPETRVAKMMQEGNVFYVLQELKTLPSIGYLARVRNRTEEELRKVGPSGASTQA